MCSKSTVAGRSMAQTGATSPDTPITRAVPMPNPICCEAGSFCAQSRSFRPVKRSRTITGVSISTCFSGRQAATAWLVWERDSRLILILRRQLYASAVAAALRNAIVEPGVVEQRVDEPHTETDHQQEAG